MAYLLKSRAGNLRNQPALEDRATPSENGNTQ